MIKAGGKTWLLSRIFWQTGRLPSEIMSLPQGEQTLIFASAKHWIEEEANRPKLM